MYSPKSDRRAYTGSKANCRSYCLKNRAESREHIKNIEKSQVLFRKRGIMKGKLLKLLEQLVKEGRIDRQAYRTYKGQVLSGNEEGCVKGLIRKKLIKAGDIDA